MKFTKKISPVCLPPPDLESHWRPHSSYFVVTGWGKTENGWPDVPMEVNLPYSSVEECRSDYGERFNATSEFCVGYAAGAKDSCQGDSGGPLSFKRQGKWVLAGVVSWGEGCARPGARGVYTKVSHFLPYIRDATCRLSRFSDQISGC